jgi:RHS repeat-associated protein
VVQLCDDDGNVIRTYDYDPYGNQLQDEDANDANPYRYCGEYYDIESGYTYLRARYYDSSIGRFVSEDPVLDGNNWYNYCNNNPMSYIDPSGQVPLLLVGLLVGAAIGTWASNAKQATENGNGWEWGEINDAGRTVKGTVTGGAAGAAVSGLAAAGLAGSVVAPYAEVKMGAGILASRVTNYGAAAGAGYLAQNFRDAGNKIGQAATNAYNWVTNKPQSIYRSVSDGELADIRNTGQFNLAQNTLEGEQFGLSLSETVKFGQTMNQTAVVSADVPYRLFRQFEFMHVDAPTFRSGIVTVRPDQMEKLNEAIGSIIRIIYE